MSERIIRVAAWPLLSRIVDSILDEEDLHQVGRIALWKKGQGEPEANQVVIARQAMIDEIRRSRWSGRSSGAKEGDPFFMASYDAWDHVSDHDAGQTDCQAASMIAVRQCIAKMQTLPQREREVLAFLALGMDQQEVAERIGLSPQRVGQLIASLRVVLARYV